MFELVSKSCATNTWVTSKKNDFKNCKRLQRCEKKGGSVTTDPSRPHGSQKIAHSCHMQSTILWPLGTSMGIIYIYYLHFKKIPTQKGVIVMGLQLHLQDLYRGSNPSYPFVRPFMGVITPFPSEKYWSRLIIEKRFDFFGWWEEKKLIFQEFIPNPHEWC